MKPEEADYVIRHYSHFMTLNEKAAYKRLSATMKATGARSDVHAQQEATHHGVLSAWLIPDDEVQRLTRDGYQSFSETTAERILAENKDAVFLNYCPKCRQLARTPKARQCRFCCNDWHGQ